MSDAASIKINPTKTNDLEFQVVIQGLEDSTPVVRFVVELEDVGYMTAFPCQQAKNEANSWVAHLVPFVVGDATEGSFRVEVIVDGYFFVPAEGKLLFIADPSVSFKQPSSKPVVTTSFKVKEVSDEPKKPAKSGVQKESAEITGQYAPTTKLLKPEFDAQFDDQFKQSYERDDEVVDYEQVNRERVASFASDVTPGDTYLDITRDNDDDDVSHPEEPTSFDAKQVAQEIVKSTVGNIAKPTNKGSLFSRDATGRPIVAGLDTPDVKRLKGERALRVKDILGGS